MKPKKPKSVRMLISIDQRYRAVLDAVRARDGVPLKWQLEKAIALWASQNGIEVTRG
jgi:hypothetical protein